MQTTKPATTTGSFRVAIGSDKMPGKYFEGQSINVDELAKNWKTIESSEQICHPFLYEVSKHCLNSVHKIFTFCIIVHVF